MTQSCMNEHQKSKSQLWRERWNIDDVFNLSSTVTTLAREMGTNLGTKINEQASNCDTSELGCINGV